MKIIEGKKIKAAILNDLKRRIAGYKTKPGLAVVLVGDDKASDVYVGLKQKAAGDIDMDLWVLKFSARDSQKDVISAIRDLNRDPSIHGIIVQLPLPKKFDANRIIRAIDPKKDADGFHPRNIRDYIYGKGRVAPVFPSAIMKLIGMAKRKLAGKRGLVIANSDLFGKMMAVTLRKSGLVAEYILADKLRAGSDKLLEADIVVSAVGKPGSIKGKMLKAGAIVIDGGITKRGQKVLGDVDANSVRNTEIFLSPVPGGVGPVTIACLLQNTFELFRKAR